MPPDNGSDFLPLTVNYHLPWGGCVCACPPAGVNVKVRQTAGEWTWCNIIKCQCRLQRWGTNKQVTSTRSLVNSAKWHLKQRCIFKWQFRNFIRENSISARMKKPSLRSRFFKLFPETSGCSKRSLWVFSSRRHVALAYSQRSHWLNMMIPGVTIVFPQVFEASGF